MGNIISGKNGSVELQLRMSNSSSDVVIALLSMAASHLAGTRSEMDLAVAISARDQSLFGRGCIGFDIRALPWSASSDGFKSDVEFFLKVIDLASCGYGAERLEYEPGLTFLKPIFEAFGRLLRFMEFIDVHNYETDHRLIPEFPYEKCTRHGCYKHKEGCVICGMH